jgi:hypothetical protein
VLTIDYDRALLRVDPRRNKISLTGESFSCYDHALLQRGWLRRAYCCESERFGVEDATGGKSREKSKRPVGERAKLLRSLKQINDLGIDDRYVSALVS